MQHIINQIHKPLIKKKKTVAVAESCTGGLLSSLLTTLSGSSRYFILGVVAYSNAVKTRILGISPALIAQKGAVSFEVARKMADGVKKIAKTDIGIGITGIAGPTGAIAGKPVGTVFIALTSAKKKNCQKFLFTGNRLTIRNKAVLKSLELLKNLL